MTVTMEDVYRRQYAELQRQQGAVDPLGTMTNEDVYRETYQRLLQGEALQKPQRLRDVPGTLVNNLIQSFAAQTPSHLRGATAFTRGSADKLDPSLERAAASLESLRDPQKRAKAEAASQGKLWPTQEGDRFYKVDPSLIPEVANSWAAQVGDQIPIMFSAAIGRALGGLVGSGVAAVAGQAGPQAAVPEEVVTVPLAAMILKAVGGAAPMVLSEADGYIRDARAYNIDQDIIDKYSPIYGAASGAIEYGQQIWNIKALKGITGPARDHAVKTVLKAVGGNVLEGLEEVTQGGLQRFLLGKAIDEMEERYPGLQIAKPGITEGMGREFGVGFGIGTIMGGAGAVQSEARRGIVRQLDKNNRELLLTPGGADGVAAANPTWAASIAAKDAPSRKDFEEVGITGWNADERKQFAGLLRNSLAARKAEAEAAAEAEQGRVADEMTGTIQSAMDKQAEQDKIRQSQGQQVGQSLDALVKRPDAAPEPQTDVTPADDTIETQKPTETLPEDFSSPSSEPGAAATTAAPVVGDVIDTPAGKATVVRIAKDGATPVVKLENGTEILYNEDAKKHLESQSKGQPAVQAEQGDVVYDDTRSPHEQAVEIYENMGENDSFGDIVDRIDSLAEQADDDTLRDIVLAYRQELSDDHDLKGRGDMDKAEQAFIDAIANAAEKPLTQEVKEKLTPDGYHQGDAYRLTGETETVSGGTFQKAEILEGHRKGETVWIRDAKEKEADVEQAKADREKQQDEFRRLRESQEAKPLSPDGKKKDAPQAAQKSQKPLDKQGKKAVAKEETKAKPKTPIAFGDKQKGGDFDVALPNSPKRVAGQWAVVEADSVLTSSNPDYDPSLQPRNRQSVASREQIAQIAMNIDPAQLQDSAVADTGAPLLDVYGQVISGNGRTEAVKKAYAEGRGDAYKTAIVEAAQQKGLDASTMKQPLLVRVIENTGDLSIQQVAELANRSNILQRSEAEVAEADAKAVIENDLMTHFMPDESGNVRAKTNVPFLNRFIEVTGAENLRKSDGSYSAAIDTRVKRAVLAAILGNNDNARQVITQAIEQADELGIKRQIDGLMASGGELLKLGKNKPVFDLSKDLSVAVDELMKYKRAFQAGEVKTTFDWTTQMVMFGEGMSEAQKHLFNRLADSKSKKDVVDYIDRYVKKADAIDPGPSMFGEAVVPQSPLELLESIENERKQAEQDAKRSLYDKGTPKPDRQSKDRPKDKGTGDGGVRDAAGRKDAKGDIDGKAKPEKTSLKFRPFDVDSLTEVARRIDDRHMTPRVKAFLDRIKKHKGKEIISDNASGTTWRGNIDAQTRTELIDAVQQVYNDAAQWAVENDPKQRPGFLLLDANRILESLGEKPNGPLVYDFKKGEWVSTPKDVDIDGYDEQTPKPGTTEGMDAGLFAGAGGNVAARNNNRPNPIVFDLKELVALARELLKDVPTVRKRLAGAAGRFQHSDEFGKILIRASSAYGPLVNQGKTKLRGEKLDKMTERVKEKIATEYNVPIEDVKVEQKRDGNVTLLEFFIKDPDYGVKVLAHEIGHAADWFPNHTLKRGNIVGHIAALVNNQKHMIGNMPNNIEDVLTPKDKVRLEKDARKLVKQMHPENMKAGERDKLVNKAKKELIRDEVNRRGIFEKNELMEELKDLSRWWKPMPANADPDYVAYREKPSELYADAVSVLLNNPEALRQRAPKFYDAFFAYLNQRPELKEAYTSLTDKIYAGTTRSEAVGRLLEGFREGREKHLKQLQQGSVKKRDIWKNVRSLFYSKFAANYKLAREARAKGLIDADNDPINRIGEAMYTANMIEGYMNQMQTQVYNRLREAGIPLEVFDLYLLGNRVIGEKGEKFAPEGMTDADWKDYLNDLRLKYGEKYKVLEDAHDQMRKIRKQEILGKIKDAKYFDQDTMDKLMDEQNYVRFDVVEYIDKRHGYGTGLKMFKRVGTFKKIAGPLESTLLQDMSMLYSLNWNSAKQSVAQLNVRLDKAMEAEKTFDGKRWHFKESTDPDLKLMLYMDQGEMKGFYVDKWQAAGFDSHDPLEYKAIANVANAIAGVQKSIYTALNPAFWIPNIVKDSARTIINVPGANPLNVAIGVIRAMPMAWKSEYGQASPELLEMQRHGAMISRANITGLTSEDTLAGQLMTMYTGRKLDKQGKVVSVGMVERVWEFYKHLGQVSERASKIAAWRMIQKKNPDMSLRDVAQMVRTEAGSPNFAEKGRMTWAINPLALFFNPGIQGLSTDLRIASQPGRRGSFWMKMAAYQILPKLMQWAVGAGLLVTLLKAFGVDDDDEMMVMAKEAQDITNSMSEYTRTNYINIALGRDENGKGVCLTIPMDHTGQAISGILHNALEGNVKGIKKALTNSVHYALEQMPGGSQPLITLGKWWSDYARGQNPYDEYRGRQIIPTNEFEARELDPQRRAAKILAKESIMQLGAGGFYRFKTGDPDQIRGELEKVTYLPGIGPIIGRFVRVSDYGVRQQLMETTEPVKAEKAMARLDIRDATVKQLRGEPLTANEEKLLKDNQAYSTQFADKKKVREQGDAIANALASAASRDERMAMYRKIRDMRGADFDLKPYAEKDMTTSLWLMTAPLTARKSGESLTDYRQRRSAREQERADGLDEIKFFGLTEKEALDLLKQSAKARGYNTVIFENGNLTAYGERYQRIKKEL